MLGRPRGAIYPQAPPSRTEREKDGLGYPIKIAYFFFSSGLSSRAAEFMQ